MGWLGEAGLRADAVQCVIGSMIEIAHARGTQLPPGSQLTIYPLLDIINHPERMEVKVGIFLGTLTTPNMDPEEPQVGSFSFLQEQEAHNLIVGTEPPGTGTFIFPHTAMRHVQGANPDTAKGVLMTDYLPPAHDPNLCHCEEVVKEGGDTPCAWCMEQSGVDL